MIGRVLGGLSTLAQGNCGEGRGGMETKPAPQGLSFGKTPCTLDALVVGERTTVAKLAKSDRLWEKGRKKKKRGVCAWARKIRSPDSST